MEVGFDGFASVVDAVGGVQICPDRAMRDPMAGLNVKAGCQEANSKTALAYVRARHSGRGDLDRVERQQEFLGALIKKSTSPATVLNPFRSVPCSCKAPRRSPSTRRPMSGTWSGSLRHARHRRGRRHRHHRPGRRHGHRRWRRLGVQWDRQRALALFEAIKQDQPVDGLVDQPR